MPAASEHNPEPRSFSFPALGNLRAVLFQRLEFFRPLLAVVAVSFSTVTLAGRAADVPAKTQAAVAGLSMTNGAITRCIAADFFRRTPAAVDENVVAALVAMLNDERRVTLNGSGFADGLPSSPAGEAAKALEALGTRVVGPLRAAATNESPQVRERAARALGRIGDPAALPELARLMEDTNRAVSLAASDALVALGTNSLPVLRRHLRYSMSPNADRAAWALGQLRDTESVPLLMQVVTGSDDRARPAAGAALAAIGSDGAKLLLDQWRDADEEQRLRMIPALDKFATPATRDHLLVTALADRSEKLRAAAVDGMAAWNDPAAPLVLMCALRDSDGANREAARKNFAQLGASAAMQILPYLDDDNPAVWQAAALALAAMSKDAARPLFDSLRDPSRTREAKQRTAWVLMNLGDLKVPYDDSQRLWIAADDWQMLAIFTDGIPAPLAEAVESKYPEQRSGALRTMAVLKLRGMETHLLRALDDPDPDVVQTAVRGLADQGYGFASQLEQIVQRGSLRASRAAAQALTEIDYRPRSQAASVEFFSSRGAVDRLVELGGVVPTHLQRRLDRSTEPPEAARLALDLATVLPIIAPDERFAVDNVMVRNAFTGSNRTARLAAVREVAGRPNLLLALALDRETNVATAARASLAALPGNATLLLGACFRSGDARLLDAAFAVLVRVADEKLRDFEWLLREPDAELPRRAAALFASRSHAPADAALRAVMAVQNRDWPRAFATGPAALPVLEKFITSAKPSELPPLFDALGASDKPEFFNLLVSRAVILDEERRALAWPAISRNIVRLEPRLLAALHDGGFDEANGAAFVLARNDRIPDDRKPDFVLFCAAAGLGRELDDQRDAAQQMFLRELRNENQSRRLRGAIWLTMLQRDTGNEGIFTIGGLVRTYTQRLDRGEPSERAEAAILLSQLGTNATPAIPALIRALGDDTRLTARSGLAAREWLETPAHSAALALATIGGASVEPLLKVWDSPDTPPDARAAAALALAQIRDPRAARVHKEILDKDPRGPVRMAAIRSLAVSEPKNVVTLLLRLLTQDRDRSLAVAASEALRGIGPEAGPQLAIALYGEDSTVQETALYHLALRRDPIGFEGALRLAHGPYSTVRSQTAKYFGSINEPRAIQPLIELLGDRAIVVQWNAAEALATYGRPAAEALIAKLADASPELRERIPPVLRTLTGETFGTDVSAWQAWLKSTSAKP